MRLHLRTLLPACATLLVAGAASPVRAQETDTVGTQLVARLDALYDAGRGGWVTKDGRLMESAVELALLLGRDDQDSPWTTRAYHSIDHARGLMDTIGGGFFEKTSDVDPMRPSFEKRSVTNARRFELWLDLTREGSDPRMPKETARIAEFFDRVLADGRGGFVAGQFGDRDLIGEANGAAIHAWLRWAGYRGDLRLRDFAWKSLDRTWEECWNAELGMMRKGTFGEILKAPQLVDQTEMGRAYLLAAHFSGRPADLERARLIGDRMLVLFEDHEKGGFRTQAMPDKQGRVKKSARVPEENARAARFLMELTAVTGESRYRQAAERALAAFAEDIEKAGPEVADWALARRTTSIDALPAPPVFAPADDKKPERRRTLVFKGKRG
jgi:uncharacterized protein YyaL (SSP411 family)